MNRVNKLFSTSRILARVAWLEAKRFAHYRVDLAFSVINRVVVVLMIVVFWSLLDRFSNTPLPITNLLGYYLIAGSVIQLAFVEGGIGSNVGKKIKHGEITNDLMKPVSLFPMLIVRNIGWNMFRYVIALIMLPIGLSLNTDSVNILKASLAFVSAALLGLAYARLIGGIAFHFVEFRGLKNAINTVVRLLQGWAIPLAIMPTSVESLLLKTPFPYMVYVPTRVLQGEHFGYSQLFFGLAWALTITIISRYIWHRSLRKYEAIGV